MKRIIAAILVVLTIIMMIVYGIYLLNNKSSNTKLSNVKYQAQILEPDENTIKASEDREIKAQEEIERQKQVQELSNINNVINMENDIGVPDEDNSGVIDIAELEITGTVDPSKWTVDGDNVVYNDKTFKGLIPALNSIHTCFTTDELIAVIIKSAGDGTEFSIMVPEVSEEALSISDRYDGDQMYTDVLTKYGEDLSWLLVINKEDYPVATMTGSSKYVIVEGTLGNITIDVSDL